MNVTARLLPENVTARLLPEEEWEKLLDREPFRSAGLPDAQHWLIPVVEIDGAIVASCGILDTVHWDGFQIDPHARKNPAVFGALLKLSLRTLQQHGVTGVHLTIPHGEPELEAMVERFGFSKSPGTLYLLRVPPEVQ